MRLWMCTYMSVQSPVVYFELVDKDFHGASDLVDLQQQLSFLSLVCTYKTKERGETLVSHQQFYKASLIHAQSWH